MKHFLVHGNCTSEICRSSAKKGYLEFPAEPLLLFLQVAPGEHLDDALPQDAAAGNARPTGKVVGIIKRNWRTRGYCGSLQPQEEKGGGGTQGVLFCPVERRFPKIRLQTRQVGGNPHAQHASVYMHACTHHDWCHCTCHGVESAYHIRSCFQDA